jgi:hypothetical protein
VPRLRRNARGAPVAPAGSPRDCFLHVREGAVADVVGGLRQRLEGRAGVWPVAELVDQGVFGTVGPALAARLGDVCVLSEREETVWIRDPPRFEQRLRGHHGGLDPREAVTFLGAWVS